MEGIIIFGAKYLIWIALFFAALVSGAWFYQTRRWHCIFEAISAAVLAFILSRVAQMFFYNPRPFVSEHFVPLIPHVPDNGFPSDHVLLLAVVALLVWRISRKWGMVLLLTAFLVGISRVAAHVHHSVDVAGSLAIALISIAIVRAFFQRFFPFKNKTPKRRLKESFANAR
ncbi:MAG TPA: phosphatase PAP2 family protein [Candidatus Paceibacterota bacterium]|nr:phosphatase PAP2 family protein [Candidatus Paceibacterota bacterium]